MPTRPVPSLRALGVAAPHGAAVNQLSSASGERELDGGVGSSPPRPLLRGFHATVRCVTLSGTGDALPPESRLDDARRLSKMRMSVTASVKSGVALFIDPPHRGFERDRMFTNGTG